MCDLRSHKLPQDGLLRALEGDSKVEASALRGDVSVAALLGLMVGLLKGILLGLLGGVWGVVWGELLVGAGLEGLLGGVFLGDLDGGEWDGVRGRTGTLMGDLVGDQTGDQEGDFLGEPRPTVLMESLLVPAIELAVIAQTRHMIKDTVDTGKSLSDEVRM